VNAGRHGLVRGAERLYAPLIALFGASLLFEHPPGEGVGFVAGLVFSLIVALHALVFGAEAAARAAPSALMRGALASGILMALVGATAPGLSISPQLVDAGAFLTTAGASLVLVCLMGRAATLTSEER
jgi:multisubunit Na+/H+ antiporter MnhB subunit